VAGGLTGAFRHLRSWTGFVFAALYAALFVALYIEYRIRAGTWFADLPLTLAALPFTLVMRALNGGFYAFGGDMTGWVVVAGLFGCALAYGIGWLVGAVLDALFGERRRREP
jgi:hypothetical protein